MSERHCPVCNCYFERGVRRYGCIVNDACPYSPPDPVLLRLINAPTPAQLLRRDRQARRFAQAWLRERAAYARLMAFAQGSTGATSLLIDDAMRLRAERDRYHAALQQIAENENLPVSARVAYAIARRALEEQT